MEKEVATHSSALAWRIPWMREPRGLLSMGSHRVRHDWSDLAVAVRISEEFQIQMFKTGIENSGNIFRKYIGLEHRWFTIFSLVAQSCPTPCDPMNRSTPHLPVHHQHPKSTQTHVHWVSDANQPSHPLCSLLLLPSIFSSMGVFSNESALHIRWPNIGVSASTSVPPMNTQNWSPLGWTGWTSVQGTLKSFLQQHSSKASILQCAAFFRVQLSHPCMTTGKIIALTMVKMGLCWQSNVSVF